MTDETKKPEITPELLAQLTAQLGQYQQSAPATGGWDKPKPKADSLEIIGVSIPISVNCDSGKLRVQLHFAAKYGASPEALSGLIETLEAAGFPLDAWKAQSGGNSWGGNSNKRGWK